MRNTLAGRLLGVIVVAVVAVVASPLLQRSRRAVVASGALLWPNHVMPYRIDGSFPSRELKELEYAISTWNNETCVTIRPYRYGDRSWVLIRDGNACHSQYIGFGGRAGEQTVTLSRNGCRYYGLYLHELGHAIGLHHEHVRPERDRIITVDYNNVDGDSRQFFNTEEAQDLESYGTNYDLQSVMHYGRSAFAYQWGLTVMEVRDSKNKKLLREVYGNVLSFWDAMVVNTHYKCASKCKRPPKCPRPGFVDQHCRCQTPSRFAKRWCVDTLGTAACQSRKADCEYDTSFMAVNCRKTCNICYIDTYAKNTKPQSTASRKPQYSSIQTTEGCFNLFPGNICQSMKEKQWCIKFEDALRGVCAKTCKLCTRSQSTNSNTKSTTTTSTTTTTTAPRESSLEACRTGDPYGCPRRSCDCTSIEIFRRCPNICENCDPCEDAIEFCKVLATHGHCNTHMRSTVPYCRKACGACDA